MKVLQIINSLETGGAEKLIIDSVPIYQSKGLDIDVICLKKTKTPFWKSLQEKTAGRLLGLTEGSIYNPILILKLVPYLKRYDVIHAHLFPVLYWVVIAKIISFSHTPIVYTEHSTNNRRRGHWIFKHVERFIYSKLNSIGCISEGTYNSLKNHLKFNEKLKLINNGIDLKSFENLNVEQGKFNYFNKDDFKIIQVSSFRGAKDQETLIHSLKYLPDHVKLLLVGDGALKRDRELQVQNLKLDDRVKFLGKRNDIPELLAYSDLVVLSSKHEGFGLAVVEGMAARKPVIASNVDGVSEIVRNYGLLFDVGNAKDLSEKIFLLLNDEKKYEEVSEKCFIRAQNYSIIKMVDKYIEVYENEL